MNYIVMAVRDRAADCFGQPFFSTSRGGAIRGFGDEVNRKEANNMLAAHPEHFDLYYLGTFDDRTGKFELLESPEQVAVGTNLVR